MIAMIKHRSRNQNHNTKETPNQNNRSTENVIYKHYTVTDTNFKQKWNRWKTKHTQKQDMHIALMLAHIVTTYAFITQTLSIYERCTACTFKQKWKSLHTSFAFGEKYTDYIMNRTQFTRNVSCPTIHCWKWHLVNPLAVVCAFGRQPKGDQPAPTAQG